MLSQIQRSLQCTERLNDPVILLGVLCRMRKLELLGQNLKYSSPEFAKEILRLAGKEEQLNPVPTSQSDLSSARPAYAVLDNFILRIIDVYEMPGWKDSLEEFMKEKREG